MANIVQTVQTKHKVWTKIQTKHEVWINAKYVFAKLDANLMQTKHANQWRTCLVQVPGQLHGGLHLHVVLEEALPERGLVVGLARLGLDGRLHAGHGHGLGHLRRRRQDAAHAGGVVVVHPLAVRHRVRN